MNEDFVDYFARLEFAGHEGNYAMAGILAGARKQEEDGARKGATYP